MMSRRSKRELLETVQTRYWKAGKGEKHRILDEFAAATGFHRKYALRLLRHGYPRRPAKARGRQAVYRGEVVSALEQIWEVYGRICSKRLHPYLPEGLKVLERWGALRLAAETRQLLLRMSSATMDRCLRPMRVKSPHGLPSTKPGSLLKKAIPVRTFADWQEDRPGFFEIDLVAHCGQTTEGQYLNTLTCTDVCTGWTEPLALWRHTQEAVCQALHAMRPELPFPLLGIDSDNGSEFINDLLLRYCLSNQITFTRSRAYQKNDQAHVEQKNWSVVRHTVGYDRLETQAEFHLLQSIYADLRLYVNFFQPVLKLLTKVRISDKFVRRYDLARTPYQRVLEHPLVTVQQKAHLTHLYVSLNPVSLRTSIDQKLAKLWRIAQ